MTSAPARRAPAGSAARDRLGSNLLLLAVLALDLATKAWAVGWLAPRGAVELAPFLHLTYVENTGAAFGSFRGMNGLFIVVSLGLMAALFVWRRRLAPGERLSRYALSAVLAGAAGNLADRLRYGYVVDFVDLRVWPVFNAADSAITVGACALAFALWKEERSR